MNKGRPKNISNPEELYTMFEIYAQETKKNPFKVKDWVGKDGFEIERLKEKPLTMVGFEVFCFKEGVIADLGDYFSNKDKRYNDFATICRAIRGAIKQDQIEGGMACIYNPSITQRINGLHENITQTNIEQPLFGDVNAKLPPSE